MSGLLNSILLYSQSGENMSSQAKALGKNAQLKIQTGIRYGLKMTIIYDGLMIVAANAHATRQRADLSSFPFSVLIYHSSF